MAIVNEREVNTMTQTYTSANTSINSAKLPAIYNKINWRQAIITNETIMDYGCGKFNNAKDFVEGIGFEWHGYDAYNRSKEENGMVLDFLLEKGTADIMICSNVLNVIDSEEEVKKIARIICNYSNHYFVTVYEGDKSGKGRVTKNDCYQRNELVKEYLKYFPNAVVYRGVITNEPYLLQ